MTSVGAQLFGAGRRVSTAASTLPPADASPSGVRAIRASRSGGVDVNAAMIEKARAAHGGVPGLSFEVADAGALPFDTAFDIVTAARVLQWLADPATAVRSMTAAAKRGGRVVVLDFNHEKAAWTPEPPASM